MTALGGPRGTKTNGNTINVSLLGLVLSRTLFFACLRMYAMLHLLHENIPIIFSILVFERGSFLILFPIL